MEKITANKNKRLRGEIVRLLHTSYPQSIEVRTLTDLLRDSGYTPASDISPQLDYLADKGYIRILNSEDIAKINAILPPSSFCKLTALGVDVAEGTVEDLGVDV